MATGIPSIQSIYISIYDTTLPYVEPPFPIIDWAERGSIHWIYDGGDSKFITMMASRLEFDMEVSIQDSLGVLVYDYLFTGNETRYNVQIADQDDRILWQGFLIPEEYVEPYDKATFFIHFTSTDGLGRLKGKTLPTSFYRARQSVMKTIADCLRLTGLDLDIWFAAALGNRASLANWERLYVDAQEWNKDDKPKNAYDILNDLLETMQCTLFQQNNRWYIIGWNKRGVAGVRFRTYSPMGIFKESIVDTDPARNLSWYATPSIAIKPPFKEVTVKENLADTVDLFPAELVSQPWQMKTNGQQPPGVKLWKNIGLGRLELLPVGEWDFKPYMGEPFEQDSIIGYIVSQPSQPSAPDFPTVPINYLEFYRPIYIKGNQLVDFDFVWEMKEKNTTAQDIETFLNTQNYYDITLNGIVIMSNRIGFGARDTFRWTGKSTWVDGYTYITCTVKVRNFLLPGDGFLNVRFIATGTTISPVTSYKRISVFNFTYRKAVQNFFKKRRVIDFTNSKAIAINHGGSVYNEMKHSFIYQSFIDMDEFQEMNYYTVPYNNDPSRVVKLPSAAAYSFVLNHAHRVYIQRFDSDFIEYIPQIIPISQPLRLIRVVFDDGHNLDILARDKFYIRTPAIAPQPQDHFAVSVREEWFKLTNNNGADRLGNVMAEICHDIYPTSIVTMEGTAKKIIQPKDLWQFELKNEMRTFIPTRIDIMPNENQSSVTMIEHKNEYVSDYGGQ